MVNFGFAKFIPDSMVKPRRLEARRRLAGLKHVKLYYWNERGDVLSQDSLAEVFEHEKEMKSWAASMAGCRFSRKQGSMLYFYTQRRGQDVPKIPGLLYNTTELHTINRYLNASQVWQYTDCAFRTQLKSPVMWVTYEFWSCDASVITARMIEYASSLSTNTLIGYQSKEGDKHRMATIIEDVTQKVPLAFGLVFIIVAWHLGSIRMACLGSFGILLAFPLAYVVCGTVL